jgi:nucleoside 2-deoxyribosyltransferase
VKVYLAARFSRANELLTYKADLERHGIEVTSRWLLGGHEWAGTDDDALPLAIGEHFAQEDLEDLIRADVVVCFTEAPRSGPSRGGRHVEYGYALAMNKEILVVGHRENVFYCLDWVRFHETWESALERLALWCGFPATLSAA